MVNLFFNQIWITKCMLSTVFEIDSVSTLSPDSFLWNMNSEGGVGIHCHSQPFMRGKRK